MKTLLFNLTSYLYSARFSARTPNILGISDNIQYLQKKNHEAIISESEQVSDHNFDARASSLLPSATTSSSVLSKYAKPWWQERIWE